jgi:uncharacterized protein
MDATQGARRGRLRQYVLKVHSRCDLACDHCYVYEAADQGWQRQPKAMSLRVLDTALMRILEHVGPLAAETGIEILLHGGEPLLLGHQRMREVLTHIRDQMGGPAVVAVAVQTNGVRLDPAFADLFVEFGVRVGVSMDGGAAATDRHRRFANGRSSFPHVRQAVELLRSPSYRSSFAALLCTVDVSNDPLTVLADLSAFAPPMIDFLLPHATWESPPPATVASGTPYGDWLVTIFDHWYEHPELPRVRLFDELMHALLGGASRSEAIGLSAPASVVIETDGTIEQTDALKVSYDGAAATGYDVMGHNFDQMLQDPDVAAASFGNSLSPVCLSCPVVAGCGGGLYPHRYRKANGFDNPSVYCRDLRRLVSHVQQRLRTDIEQQEVLVP